MRIGIVCPYSLDVAGGVQRHVLDLAAALRTLGHTVEVLAPTTGTAPEFVTPAGRAVGVPYNGSVARVAFGPLTRHRTRRWLAAHNFDVLHVHEPTTPSVSALALLDARGPVVATFHTSTERSRALAAFGPVARPLLERVTARIAVSATARRVQVEHLGGDATEIPNGVDLARFAHGPALDLPPAVRVGYVGRFDEPRKGMPVLLAALRRVVADRPDVRLLVV
ncbi:glycosyltransferase family 4 protein, partial [Pseudonocardia sp. SID8383]